MINKILSVMVNLLCVAAITAAGFAIWTISNTPPGQAPTIFGMTFMTVLTGSMEPELKTGSLIAVRDVPAQQLEVRDIISFYSANPKLQGRINTHRIVEIGEKDGNRVFTTKGDANDTADSEVITEERVIGEVVWKSYALGTVIGWVQNKYVFLGIILIPLVFILITSIRKVVLIMREEVRVSVAEAMEEGNPPETKDTEDTEGKAT